MVLRSVRALAAVALLVAGCGSTGDEVPDEGASATTGAGGHPGTASSHAATTGADVGSGGAGGAVGLGPPYPVVLAHGFFGFEKFAGVDFATYFYGVKARLAEVSGEEVYTPAVDPFNDSEYRGAQLLQHVQQILADTGAAKVNLIGHSQGGLDARWVAHERPDLIASVVTIATPHGGTPIADIALQLVDHPEYEQVLDWLAKSIGAPLYDEIGDETSVSKPLHLFSKEGIAAFNAKFPDQPGVMYASIGGRTDFVASGPECTPDVGMPFMSAYETTLDPVDPLLDLTETILDGGFGESHPNDGLVRVVDSRHGQFWGCLPADHLDEIGQLFGDGPGPGNDWDHRDFYVALVAHLRAEGY